MKGRKVNEYTKNGNVVSVFELSGTPAELSAYEAHQGANFRADEESGKPLFYATKQANGIYEGDTVDITFVEKDGIGYIIDQTETRRVNQLLEKHAGTALGDALASQLANEMLAKARGKAPVKAAPVAPSSGEE